MSKAFDSVDHDILLKKLHKFGLRGSFGDLLKSYLHNQSQYVQIGEDISSTQLIKCGVPQGSTLGPLLFSLYINDLPSTTTFHTRLYADDTALFMFDENLCTLNKRVNDELVNIDNWLKSNKLTPNYTKTKFMIISHDKNAKSNFEVTINKVPISNCYSYKYLGIIFDDDLKWKTHFEHVSKKMSQAAGIIAKLRNYVSGRHLKLVYNCFAQCYLQYGVLCWGNSSKTIMEPLQKQQNKILKLMSGIKRNDYVRLDQVYHAEKMLKVSDIARLELAKFMYRYHKFKVPNLFITENYFTPVNEIHSYNTRSSSSKCYFLPTVNTTAGKRSLLFRGTKLWNAIPVDIKQYPYHKFVKYYKNYLIHKYQN